MSKHNSKLSKSINPLLKRRFSMRAFHLSLITIFTFMLCVIGCSKDVNPVSTTEFSLENNNQFSRINPNSNESISIDAESLDAKLITFTAIAYKTDNGAGCWYLKATNGNCYTPLVPSGLELKLSMELVVTGYVDWDILLFCGNGPAFVIEKYQIVSSNAPTGFHMQSSSANPSSKPVPIIFYDSVGFPPKTITLDGVVRYSKNGCQMIYTDKGEIHELYHDMDLVLREYTKIQTVGYFKSFEKPVCGNSTVFYADQIVIVEDGFSEIISVSGEVERFRPEGGCWRLVTENKDVYELRFTTQPSLSSGSLIRVTGTLNKAQTFCMLGPLIEVSSWMQMHKNMR